MQPYTPSPGPLREFERSSTPYFDTVRESLGELHFCDGEDHATKVAKVFRHFKEVRDLSVSAGHVIALGIDGFDYAEAGRRAVHRALSLSNRDQARFRPTSVRGDLAGIENVCGLAEANPAIAVNLSALRCLKWDGGVTAGDIFLLWILLGFAASEAPLPPIAEIGRRFGFAKPERHLAALKAATFSFDADATVPLAERLINEPVLDRTADTLRISNALLRSVMPVAGGENYAHVELLALGAFTRAWHERAYRSLLAAAVRARAYWSGGGGFSWTLPLGDVALLAGRSEISAKTALELLRTWQAHLHSVRRPKPEREPEQIEGSRVSVMSIDTDRAEIGSGRAVTGYTIYGRVSPADWREMPKAGIGYLRTEERGRHCDELSLAHVTGLGGPPPPEEVHKKRSEAARLGWLKRRNTAGIVGDPSYSTGSRIRDARDTTDVGLDAFLQSLVCGRRLWGKVRIRSSLPIPTQPSVAEVREAAARLTSDGIDHRTCAPFIPSRWSDEQIDQEIQLLKHRPLPTTIEGVQGYRLQRLLLSHVVEPVGEAPIAVPADIQEDFGLLVDADGYIYDNDRYCSSD